LQRARALELAAEPRMEDGKRETDEEAVIRLLLEREVRTPKADEAVCLRYYDSNPRRFRSADLFEPAHILFKARRDDAPAYGKAVAQAEVVLAELAERPDRFEGLARSLSDCPSAPEGGRLGQIVLGETTPEFETFLVAMAPGQICPAPVHTPYGVHVLRLNRKIEGVALPFEAVRDRIAAYLEERTWRRAVSQYVSLLAGQARIAGFDMPGASSPLVQ
jgi:peptidyl-prolyl cis-trans isomerase C